MKQIMWVLDAGVTTTLSPGGCFVVALSTSFGRKLHKDRIGDSIHDIFIHAGSITICVTHIGWPIKLVLLVLVVESPSACGTVGVVEQIRKDLVHLVFNADRCKPAMKWVGKCTALRITLVCPCVGLHSVHRGTDFDRQSDSIPSLPAPVRSPKCLRSLMLVGGICFVLELGIVHLEVSLELRHERSMPDYEGGRSVPTKRVGKRFIRSD
mmetsp:Transcript_4237/g.7324  ORF Transcript_4237/g.7324 Transcript_4237/m.7324 type:complete len:210 (-) Transcript_4237:320-949(-)